MARRPYTSLLAGQELFMFPRAMAWMIAGALSCVSAASAEVVAVGGSGRAESKAP